MKSLEQSLRLQAWLDGELPAHEACEVEAWLQEDPEAQALADELQQATRLSSDHELCRPVPDTREFYWSQIARGIEQAERVEQREAQAVPGRHLPWWRHWWTGAAASAALVLIIAAIMVLPKTRENAVLAIGHEIETPLQNVELMTFRSESEQMTVVWVDFNVDE